MEMKRLMFFNMPVTEEMANFIHFCTDVMGLVVSSEKSHRGSFATGMAIRQCLRLPEDNPGWERVWDMGDRTEE
jgi:hypothetical protein